MKYSLFALAAACTAFTGVSANRHNHIRRHNNHGGDVFKRYEADKASYGCTTYVTTRVHTITKYPEQTQAPEYECLGHENCPPAGDYPVPDVSTFPETDVYTIPGKTVTVTRTLTTIVPDYNTLVPTTFTSGTYTWPESTITITITKTSHVTIYPFETGAPGPEGPKGDPVPKPPDVEVPKYTPAAPENEPVTPHHVTPKVEKPKPVETPMPVETPKPVETPMPIETPKAEKPKPKPPKVPTPPSGNADKTWSISYSAFSKGGCRSKEQIYADIADITSKGFSVVRVYSPECEALTYVVGACKKYGCRIIAGIEIDYVRPDGEGFVQKQVQEYKQFGGKSIIEMVVCGNEAIHMGKATPEKLMQACMAIRTELQGAGYTCQFTTAETVDMWEKHGSTLCPIAEVIGANIQPFFDPNTSAENVGVFFKRQIKAVGEVCPGKDVYVLEAGWPQGGYQNSKAIPGPHEQKIAIANMQANIPAGVHVSWFTYRNDDWKQPGQFGIEDKFGCGDYF